MGPPPDLADVAAALTDWLPARRWFAGKGRAITSIAVDEIEVPHSRRVRLFLAHVTFDDGETQSYSVPLLADDGGSVAAMTDAMTVERGASAIVELALDTGRDHEVRLLGAEQSNSSVIVDEVMIAKLVRRLEPGRNPDVDLPRHLSRVGFAHAPGLIASFDVDLPDSTSATAVIVHDAISNRGDLWSWIADHPDRGADIAELVGRRTAELHVALATTDRQSGTPADLWPEPSTLDDQRHELAAIRQSLVTTQQMLGDRSRPLAVDPDRVLQRFARLGHDVIDVSRIRVHGDLHLGQILWTGDDVMFIDFEGEPARPMTERAVKRPGLVDVAGLLRSFDYAGRNADLPTQWVVEANRRLLDAYLATIRPPLVPSDDDDTRLLLDLYLLDKALYEIRYEIASRPDWLHLPLRAAEELVSQG